MFDPQDAFIYKCFQFHTWEKNTENLNFLRMIFLDYKFAVEGLSRRILKSPLRYTEQLQMFLLSNGDDEGFEKVNIPKVHLRN